MLKKLSLALSVFVFASTGFALESLNDEALSGAVAQDGVDMKINYQGTVSNLYYETNDGSDAFRFNLGGFRLDTDNTGNSPIDLSLDVAGTDLHNGIDVRISGVENLDLYADKIGVQKNNSAAQIYGTLGLQDVSFNGGEAAFQITAVPGDGDQGVTMRLSLPDGTTGNVLLGDESAQLLGKIEINGFSVVQTVDVVDLDPTDDGNPLTTADENLALKMIINEMEGSFDLQEFRVVDSAGIAHRQGSYGRLTIDKLHVKSGYTIVDSIQY